MVSLPVSSNHGTSPPEGANGGDCGPTGARDNRCGNGLEKIYKTTAVRYGYMKHIGEFSVPGGTKFTCGAKVVIQTQRGIEVGEQVSLSCGGCDRTVSREQLQDYIKRSGAESYLLENGRILREATVDDLAEDMRLRQTTTQMKRFAQQHADSLSLNMRVVECEYLLGGDRAIFYFLADGRVDFRALVKDLSREFQTRIKMHQVGARDEARLLADYETCGRQVCCKAFLKTLRPITMRMAKLQRATLDPSKVSGRCGRLKCCLRYEHEAYESLDAKLPKVGEKVQTSHGYGTVVKRQILTQLVQVRPVEGAGALFTVVIEDVVERGIEAFPERAPAPQPGDARRSESAKSGWETRDKARSAAQPKSEVRTAPSRGKTPGSRPPADGKKPEPKQSPTTAGSKARKRSRGRKRRPRSGGKSGGSTGPGGTSGKE